MIDYEIPEIAAALDIRYWKMRHIDRCPNRGWEWTGMHPEANLMPHFTRDCAVRVSDAEGEK